MCGFAAQVTEIAGRINYPGAEMIMPDAIYKHPRGQRVFIAGNPSRQRQPAFAFGRVSRQGERLHNPSQDGQALWRRRRAAPLRIAALMYVGGLFRLLESACPYERQWLDGFQLAI